MTSLTTTSALRRFGWAVLLWSLALLFLAPFAWMISTSLKRNIDVFDLPIQWIPDTFQWSNYAEVWTGEHSIARYFLNSVVVAAARVFGELLTASMAGYAFARLSFRGRDKVFLLYLATALIPFQLLLVPRFMYFQQLGIYDTLLALILPGMFTVIGTFLMRQYFTGLPPELREAARIDGASEWRIYWNVYLPLARPVLAALGILAFVWSWNDYESPLVLLTTDSNYTIPIGLTNFADESGGLSAGLAMAGSVSSLVPVILLFLLLQKRFIQALTRAGLK
ncbi:carbohydrate ABC transporter permease [Streptomyces sp. A7024]|uniref:Carbohydrate ABC transporter permease n=1 Tax=Streptomyces coryli TaxID=1128680 RepID=A0A6G4TSU4_9ACTN|nr:carbohydrate ABC transporter permease [Streptomyces coryli]NGN62536.1 carbohydrate ABC transporter permease [Streptomyces coryli]